MASAADDRGHLGLRPGRLGDRRPRRAAADRHPGEEPGREVRATERDQLAVLVDLLAAPASRSVRDRTLVSVAATRAIPSAAGTTARMSPGRAAAGSAAAARPGAARRPRSRTASARSRTADTTVDADHRDEDAGHARPPLPQAEDDDQAGDPDRQGDRVRLAVRGRRSTNDAAALDEAVAVRAEPEQPGQLADDDDQRDAVEVAVPDRRGQEVGQEPEPGDRRRR